VTVWTISLPSLLLGDTQDLESHPSLNIHGELRAWVQT
jgi:hypothetical protein